MTVGNGRLLIFYCRHQGKYKKQMNVCANKKGNFQWKFPFYEYFQLYYSSTRITILLFLHSTSPPLTLNLSSLSFISLITTSPFSNVETIGACMFSIWNDPFEPGTFTMEVSPSNNFFSGVMISTVIATII